MARRSGRDGPAGLTMAGDLGAFDRASDDYLAYLAVERGLAPATIRAYRGDLADFRREAVTRTGAA